MKSLKKVSMNDEYAKQISFWQYEDEYQIYNLPSFEEMKKNNYRMVNPARSNDYICYVNKENEVVAYTSTKESEEGKIFFWIGLKPNFCGKGVGRYFLQDSLNRIKERYPDAIIYLEVQTWNLRAINAYKRIGFTTINTIMKKDCLGNDCEFTEMELNI